MSVNDSTYGNPSMTDQIGCYQSDTQGKQVLEHFSVKPLITPSQAVMLRFFILRKCLQLLTLQFFK